MVYKFQERIIVFHVVQNVALGRIVKRVKEYLQAKCMIPDLFWDLWISLKKGKPALEAPAFESFLHWQLKSTI